MKRKSKFKFLDIDNPISEEIKDVGGLADSFQKVKLIPYAGGINGSHHSLLKFVNNAKMISPTLGACHGSVKRFAFAQKLNVQYNLNSDFVHEVQEVANETKNGFIEFLKEVAGNSFDFSQAAEKCYDNYFSNGNVFVEIVMTETNGIKDSEIRIHNTEKCVYWATKKGKPKFVAISDNFEINYLEKNGIDLVAVYPNFTKRRNTIRTVIHVKNGGEWYGRPNWIASFQDVYREYQDNSYLIKMAGKNFTGQVFIETEDADGMSSFDEEDAIESGFDNVQARVEANFSQSGDDPSTIMLSSRPYGAKPALVHQFKPVTNENFFKTTKEISRQSIIESWSWSERLLGSAVSEGFSNDSFISELKVKELGVLPEAREFSVKALNKAFRVLSGFYEKDEYRDLNIFYMPIDLNKWESQ